MTKQTTSRFLNAALLIAIALVGYGLTVYFDGSKPPENATNTRIIAQDNEPLTDFTFTDISGESHSLKDFQGKIVIINFWATWCAPCVVEFPALLKIAAENKNKVVLIALSSDTGETEIRQFLAKQKTPADNVYIAHDREDLTLKMFGVNRLPETLITDRDLKKREKLIGAEWTPETLQKIIDSL